MRKLTFLAGAAIGYVLGARAGRERYEQMKTAAQRVRTNPAVRNTVDSAALTGRQATARAAGAVADRADGRLPQPVTRRLRSVQERAWVSPETQADTDTDTDTEEPHRQTGEPAA